MLKFAESCLLLDVGIHLRTNHYFQSLELLTKMYCHGLLTAIQLPQIS